MLKNFNERRGSVSIKLFYEVVQVVHVSFHDNLYRNKCKCFSAYETLQHTLRRWPEYVGDMSAKVELGAIDFGIDLFSPRRVYVNYKIVTQRERRKGAILIEV